MSESPSVHRAAAEGFSSGAETYVRGRPDYPPQALDWLRDVLGLGPGKTVIDLGAGTGKFTKVLLTTGASVIAVEPVAPMLERLRRDLLPEGPQSPGGSGVEPSPELRTSSELAASSGRAAALPSPEPAPSAELGTRSECVTIAGTAERIPVATGAVDAVVCAQAFHWFATPAALAEIRRVLKPGGALGLIWNQRDESVDWVAALGKLFERYEGDAPRMKSGEWRKLFPAPGFTPLQEVRFPHTHVGPPERVIIDRFMSVSFIAALPATEREQALTQVRDLIARTPALAGRSEVSVPYVTMAFQCRRLAAGAAA